MLQLTLLLLGCALSRQIWEINTTVASVVLGVTSFGIFCYASIVVAGTTSPSCPYQTPGAQAPRYLRQKVSNHSRFFVTKSLATQYPGIHLGPEQILDQEVTALDFHCISSMLQTSLDRGINYQALKFLGSIIALPGSKTTIALDCFNILISCVSATGDSRAVALRGSEQLVETAATCLLGAISHSLITDPASNVLEDMRQRYRRVFSPTVDLRTLPSYPTISAIHNLFNKRDRPKGLDWKCIDPSTPENISLAHNLVKIAWSWYRGLEGSKKVPRWVLRFSLHYLLRDPELPMSVIADCLLIVAIDLGCDVLENDVRNLDKRCALPAQLHNLSPDRSSARALGISWMRYPCGLNRSVEPPSLLSSTVSPSPYSRYGQPSWKFPNNPDSLTKDRTISDTLNFGIESTSSILDQLGFTWTSSLAAST